MDSTVQQAIQELITALIRSLGPNHGKLLTLMRNFPKGSESLALRVLAIFTDHGRASSQLVALVKALINERDLDARFLIPIIAEMDKVNIRVRFAFSTHLCLLFFTLSLIFYVICPKSCPSSTVKQSRRTWSSRCSARSSPPRRRASAQCPRICHEYDRASC